jgi:hypothetical protein
MKPMSDRKIEGKEPMTHIDPKRVKKLAKELMLNMEGVDCSGPYFPESWIFHVEGICDFILTRESQKDEQIARLEAEKREAVEALQKIAKGKLTGELPTSEWSMGNYDDVFADGVSLGEHYAAEIASAFLAKSAQQSGEEKL